MPLDLFSILSTKNEKLNLSIFLLAWKERTEELFWSNMYLNLRKYIQFWHLKRRHLKAAVERLLPSLPPHFWNADLLLFIVLRRGGWGSSPYLTEATNLPAKSNLVTMCSCALYSFLCAHFDLVPSLLNELLPFMSCMFSSFIYPCAYLRLRIRACVYLCVFLTLCFLYFMCFCPSYSWAYMFLTYICPVLSTEINLHSLKPISQWSFFIVIFVVIIIIILAVITVCIYDLNKKE